MSRERQAEYSRSLFVALLAALALSHAAPVLAQPAAISADDKNMMGACAALGLKIVQNGQQFAPEFRRLGGQLLFMPAVMEPPLKDDPDFIAGRESMGQALGAAAPSERSPVYLQSISRCVDWANRFTASSPPQAEK